MITAYDTFRPHKCDVYGEAFAARFRLNYHMRKHKPAGGKDAKDRIKCPKCPRTFVHKQSLQRHTVKHSGEK